MTDEYGPHSQAVASALMTLDNTRWLEQVGQPWQERVVDRPDHVAIIRSWDESLTIFGEDLRYNANGVLEAPCARVDPVLERYPERKAWWQKARDEAKRYTVLRGWAPQTLAREQRDLIFEYLYEFVSMLLAEIGILDMRAHQRPNITGGVATATGRLTKPSAVPFDRIGADRSAYASRYVVAPYAHGDVANNGRQ